MGQYFGFERIAQPTHSGGTITLPPSVLKIGGQGHQTTQSLQVSIGSPLIGLIGVRNERKR